MGKSDTIKSDGNGGKSLIEAMKNAKASVGGNKRIPSITLTKEGESRASEETLQQSMLAKPKNPFNREKSRRMIFQMKKPATLENNNDEENKSSIVRNYFMTLKIYS